MEDIYKKYLDELIIKLVAKYDELGLRASGKYEQELEYEIQNNSTGDKLIVYGAFHAQFMESGREPGKFPPRKAIEDWIEVKSSLPSIFREKKSQFAFLIARKIAKEGIQVPNIYNKGKVVSSVIEEFLTNELGNMLNEIGLQYVRQIRTDIKTILQAA